MRIEESRRELTGKGYRIVSTTGDYENHSNYYGDPIKMSLTHLHGHILCNNLEELISTAEPESAFEGECSFEEIYGDLMRGIRSDWQLGEIEVYPGGIMLGYGGGDTELPYEGQVYIRGIELDLTFKTPRTRLGFDPIYRVCVQCGSDGTLSTRVDEDLGYMRRTIYFAPKGIAKTDEILPADSQVVRILECVGM